MKDKDSYSETSSAMTAKSQVVKNTYKIISETPPTGAGGWRSRVERVCASSTGNVVASFKSIKNGLDNAAQKYSFLENVV